MAGQLSDLKTCTEKGDIKVMKNSRGTVVRLLVNEDGVKFLKAVDERYRTQLECSHQPGLKLETIGLGNYLCSPDFLTNTLGEVANFYLKSAMVQGPGTNNYEYTPKVKIVSWQPSAPASPEASPAPSAPSPHLPSASPSKAAR